ncbi:MAG: hypothetical protein IH592_14450 [Bacteroidales bacterium]|nr:hypothetical protein [Bacteroidales bacterium]
MDELEKHIRDHRDEMDIHDPDPALWKRIEKGLPAGKSNLRQLLPGGQSHRGRWLLRAAAAVIIATAGLVAIFSGLRNRESLNDPRVTAVQETYYYYDSQIRMLYREAEPLLTANPDISSELKLGMGELDSLSAQIIRDLHDNIASQEVLEALVTNYRLRIELLEDMLQLMQKNEDRTEKTTGNEL